MDHTKLKKGIQRALTILKYLGIVVVILGVYYILHRGITSFDHQLSALILSAGLFGPLLFVLFQIIQVIIPILPGGVSLSLGVLAFGTTKGFIYNYIGIVVGSIISFLLIRRFGKPLLKLLVSEKNYQKVLGYLENKQRFTYFFAGAILFPIAPDDLLCMVAGLTKMRLRTFVLIIILCKPISILVYSYLITYLVTHI